MAGVGFRVAYGLGLGPRVANLSGGVYRGAPGAVVTALFEYHAMAIRTVHHAVVMWGYSCIYIC